MSNAGDRIREISGSEEARQLSDLIAILRDAANSADPASVLRSAAKPTEPPLSEIMQLVERITARYQRLIELRMDDLSALEIAAASVVTKPGSSGLGAFLSPFKQFGLRKKLKNGFGRYLRGKG